MNPIDFSRYAVPLRPGRRLGARATARREGLLVTWRDVASEACGRGEAAPAYWLGEPTADSTEEALRAVLADHSADELAARLDSGSLSAPAAVRCALDTALLDLRARLADESVVERLGGRAGTRIDVAAIVGTDTPDEIRREAADRVASGFRVLKLKVGGRDVAEDVARIDALREGGDGRVLLRLDANRSWQEEEAAAVLAAVAAPDIEYVEEPLRTHDLVALARLRSRAGVPIAMDESVVTLDNVTRLAECGACDTIVLKLARVGGPRTALALAQHARRLGLRVAVTDSIETAVGRAAAVHTAAALPAPQQAVGLGGAMLLADSPEPVASEEASGPGLDLR